MKQKERYTMTEPEKSIIRRMRESGASYSSIADYLCISPNTVKSFCQRNDIHTLSKQTDRSGKQFCAQCGQPITQQGNRKPKRFCSDQCRSLWWNRHRQELSKKTAVITTCACCGNRFESYPQEHRRYCCHACYIQARFRGNRP